jgi:hypothetical protein
MKTASKKLHIFTYGRTFSKLRTEESKSAHSFPFALSDWNPSGGQHRHLAEYLLVSSRELDDAFTVTFRRYATEMTRLIVFHDERVSSDRLFSKIVDMQIRTPQRCCLIDATFGHGKDHYATLATSILKRLTSVLETKDQQDRILYAKIENDILHVVSQNFLRLNIPVSKIPEFQNSVPGNDELEIDEDGSFIYWPTLDVHLGWEQLQQLVNPEAALKASQKNKEFNVRYGKAVERVRQMARLAPSDIPELSARQLRRIESGECRITSKAIAILAAAHKLTPNEYLKTLSANLK